MTKDHVEPSLEPGLKSALENFAQQDNILVALDFDGTLAPFVAMPEDARMSKKSAKLLKSLSALPDTNVALVSGRNLESLNEVASPDKNFYLVGSHGAEMNFGDTSVALTPSQKKTLKKLTTSLQELSSEHDGSHVELKPAAAVLHYRDVAPSEIPTVQAAVDSLQKQFPGAHMMAGNKVYEFAVLKTHKGEGLQVLRKEVKANAILFAGDDVTDENGFKVLCGNDIGIKVGLTGPRTSAQYSVANIPTMEELLDTLLFLRSLYVK